MVMRVDISSDRSTQIQDGVALQMDSVTNDYV